MKELYDERKSKGKFIVYTVSDPYEKTQGVIGQVPLLTTMVEDPDLIRDIFETHVTLMMWIGMAKIKGFRRQEKNQFWQTCSYFF